MAKADTENRRGVLISGAYGLGNPGDEAILEAILARIREADNSIPVTVLSRSPAQTAERFKIRALKSFSLFRIIKTLKSCSLLISGGGSLLQIAFSTRSLLYYLYIIRLAKRMGCRVLMYGCGIGPIKGGLSKKLAAKTIDSCADCITLRDSDALESLKELGVDPTEEEMREMAESCTRNGKMKVGAVKLLDTDDIVNIYKAAKK